MDTRARILVVEDIEVARETLIAVLDRADYSVDGVATAASAISTIDSRCYHVALVDIMLAGKDDTTDRGGAKVLQYLKQVRDPTHALVLSAQKNDVTLVRDLIKRYGALDYIAKWEFEEKGNEYLLQQIKDAMPKSAPLTWADLTKSLIWNWMEAKFVSNSMHLLKFGGGFENLSRSLISACQHLVPLLVEKGAPRAMDRHPAAEVFSGIYWSRGQGVAVEILIHGKNVPSATIEKQWDLSEGNVLYHRTKSDLSVIAIKRPELPRTQFISLLS